MDIPDAEIEQLYAARYGFDTFVNSPILRDSLENSSDGGTSRKSSLRSNSKHSKFFQPHLANIHVKIDKFDRFGNEHLSPQHPQKYNGGLLKIITDKTSDEPHSAVFNSNSKFFKPDNYLPSLTNSTQYKHSPRNYQEERRSNSEQNLNSNLKNINGSCEHLTPRGPAEKEDADKENRPSVRSINANDRNELPSVNSQSPTNKSLLKSEILDSIVPENTQHSDNQLTRIDQKNNLTSQTQRITSIFHDESYRTHSPVSAAIRNLMAYQQQQHSDFRKNDFIDETKFSPVDSLVRKEQDSVQPPILPPRRPSLLRVVTENQLLETSSPTPLGPSSSNNNRRHSNSTHSDKSDAPSPPYFRGGIIKEISPASARNKLNSRNQESSSSPGGRSSIRQHANQNCGTPSPRGKGESYPCELNNPAGLLAYVTRDSNSPHVERTVTGYVKGRKTFNCSPNEHNVLHKGGSINHVDCSEPIDPESLTPVKVLPSKVDSLRVAEMFRNFQRTTESNGNSPKQRLLEDTVSHNSVFIVETESPKVKREDSFVKSISRTISRRKNSLRHHGKLDELVNESCSSASECSVQKRSHKSNVQANIKKSSRIYYESFVDESDGLSRSGSSRNESECEYGNEMCCKSLTPSVDHEIVSRRREVRHTTAEPECRKDETCQETCDENSPANQLWSFTTKVVFPKSKFTS